MSALHSKTMKENIQTESPSIFKKLGGKLINGAVAGITGVSVIYPIDMVKTRLQNQKVGPNNKLPYSGMFDCFKKIVATEGVKGLYRGIIPNLVGITPEKAIKLAVNDSMRDYFAKKSHIPSDQISLVHGMISGAVAGFCQVIATNPMEVVKIQLQVATQPSVAENAAQTHTPPKKPLSAIQVVKSLGIKGLYRGSVATLLRDVPFSIIFFPLSAISAQYIQSQVSFNLPPNQKPQKPQFSSIFAGGMIAGVSAAIAVTPADVIKTRLQADLMKASSTPKIGFWQMGSLIVKNEGWKALFKGSIPRAMTTAPLFGIALMTYELQQRYFPIN
ncbi:hypothetical protein BB560_004524 [Smittium megazygosporum]|uniref:Mitochondrial carrier protein n=1 Tax=Smittium megazygosporum TaxID=133381 RepID=A0A2T9Z907_9FUNG|nr:hypothetical protein BB560_004524 [Smittium megazygosporum]